VRRGRNERGGGGGEGGGTYLDQLDQLDEVMASFIERVQAGVDFIELEGRHGGLT
jgi:hypothetical protein